MTFGIVDICCVKVNPRKNDNNNQNTYYKFIIILNTVQTYKEIYIEYIYLALFLR